MLVTFDPLVLLLWIFAVCFVPGAILSFSVLRNTRLLAIEKALIGFGLGIIILPLFPFLLYLFAGIKFSYMLAIFSAALFYLVSLFFLFRSKAYEDIKMPKLAFDRNLIISAVLALLLILSFWIRILPLSPIFFELDPYYYTYVATQILTFGENPFDDQTAWYPDLTVNHRTVPALGYLEATWYALYTGGGPYDNMLLSLVAAVYPPIAGALAVFFLYLFVSSFYRREYGIMAAGIASFIPIFLFKTTSGIMEIQPYAFFALSFFLAMYAFMLKEKKMLYAGLAAAAYAGLVLGSSTEVVGITALLIFIPLQSIMHYLKGEDEELKTFLIHNSVVFLIGTLFFGNIIRSVFSGGFFLSSSVLMYFAAIAFGGILYFVRQRIPNVTMQRYIIVGFAFVGVVLFFLTPLGTLIKGYITPLLGIAQYNVPLDRTIAEQHPAGTDLSGNFGFISMKYSSVVYSLFSPLINLLTPIQGALVWVATAIGGILDAVFYIPSMLVNLILDLSVRIINLTMGTSIEYTHKVNSLLLLWIGLFWAAALFSLYRFIKHGQTPVLLFVAVILPPLLIGIIKAKYLIYGGFLLAAGIGFIFGEAEKLLAWMAKKTEDAQLNLIAMPLIAAAALLLAFQFFFSAGGFAPAILSESYKERFQDDPSAFSGKFSSMCTEFTASGISEQYICSQYASLGYPFCTVYDSSICTVAADPLAYASKGTNEQYNQKLCYYSLISNITNPSPAEVYAADFRCKRLSTYWIESMEWINENTPEGSRFASWWDYGHWINYFGERNAVVRNEHSSLFLIGEVANGYLEATPEELADFMRSRDIEYAIFDYEIIGAGSFGGKYGALNYLMCARNNETNVSMEPTFSQCESEHLWETILVPSTTNAKACMISEAGNKTGITAYKAYWRLNSSDEFKYTSSYPQVLNILCAGDYLNSPNIAQFCQANVVVRPAYCIGDALLANGQTTYGTYLLNETEPNGDLRLNKAQYAYSDEYSGTLHLGDMTALTLVYTDEKIFLENGNTTDGYDDRSTKFYSSSLYRALILDDLPGFTKAFETQDHMVKIYQLED